MTLVIKTITNTIYDAPKVEIVELRVEQGFAVSGIRYGSQGYAGDDSFYEDFGKI